jgi:hypothetical protein
LGSSPGGAGEADYEQTYGGVNIYLERGEKKEKGGIFHSTEEEKVATVSPFAPP